jgi:hypothetical protein
LQRDLHIPHNFDAPGNYFREHIANDAGYFLPSGASSADAGATQFPRINLRLGARLAYRLV